MKKADKNKLYEYYAGLSDSKLEEAYYDLVYRNEPCGEDLYELGYSIEDCKEADRNAKYERELYGIIEDLCSKRGIKLFENQTNYEKLKNLNEEDFVQAIMEIPYCDGELCKKNNQCVECFVNWLKRRD